MVEENLRNYILYQTVKYEILMVSLKWMLHILIESIQFRAQVQRFTD